MTQTIEVLPNEVSPEQATLNGVLEKWGADHVKSPRHSTRAVANFDPIRFPEQLMEVPAIEVERPIGATDEHLLAYGREALAKLFGGEESADSFVRDFNLPEFLMGPSLVESIQEALDRGENVGMLLCHAHMADVMLAPVALALATNSMDLAEDTVAVMSKLLTREVHLDASMTQDLPLSAIVRPWAKQTFPYPSSENAKTYGLPEDIEKSINQPAIRYLFDTFRPKITPKRGKILAVAPFGSVVDQQTEENGALAHIFPKLPDQSVSLCARLLDKALAITMIPDPNTGVMRWRIGELTDVSEIVEGANLRSAEATSKMREFIREQFSSQLGELTGARVVFKDDEEEAKTLP